MRIILDVPDDDEALAFLRDARDYPDYALLSPLMEHEIRFTVVEPKQEESEPVPETPPDYPFGTRLLDSEGDEWEWLGDRLPEPLPIGRAWLKDAPGPYLCTVRGSTVMPYDNPERAFSAFSRYGPFRVLGPGKA